MRGRKESVSRWSVRPARSRSDLASAFRIRELVFIDEQACPREEEFDGLDEESRHLLLLDGDRAAGASRWRAVEGGAAAKLERFAVLPAFRGRGGGKHLVEATLADARAAGYRRFLLHAQVDKRALYAGFGFRAEGGRFTEAGIEHVRMVLEESVG